MDELPCDLSQQELREERDRLLQLAAIGDVLSAVLHQLKNPLAGATTALEVLLEELPPGDAQRQLHLILRELRRVKLALDGVGCAGRPLRTTNHHAIDFACRDAFLLLSERAAARGITLRCDVDDMPLLPIDASVIRAIVFNLLTNAIAACRRGDTIVMHARFRSVQRVFELTVVDNGRGMSVEEHARCTDLFYSTRPNRGGLGLTQCLSAVEEAKGTMEIKSVIGAGTRVAVRVPAYQHTKAVTKQPGGKQRNV